MYLVKVLVEHPVDYLDHTFDYLSENNIVSGVRVIVPFGAQRLMGYVEGCEWTDLTKEALEKKSGFQYQFVLEQIDEKPLLNQELQLLASRMAKMTLSPKIACLQVMLPTQLKPSRSKATGIQYTRYIKLVDASICQKTPKQQQLLNYMIDHPFIPLKDCPYSSTIVEKVVSTKALSLIQVEAYRDPYILQTHTKEEPQLTSDQESVLHALLDEKHQEDTSLLYGVTGSGKTEVYLQSTKAMLNKGKQVIVLVPEISLTPMMVKVFKARFANRVAVLHSKLSQGERYDEYRRIRDQKVDVVVGARSAVFAPLENIGMIIIDEEHEASYKQESSPRYYTHTIARMRCDYHHAALLLASATPSIESYARAQKGIYRLYELKKRINQREMPHCDIVDMSEELRSHHYSIFSRAMLKKIESCLDRGEQMILLLNRRGYANYLICQHCHHVFKCPHCDVTLTYHKEDQRLKCHYCEYQIPIPTQCPECHEPLKKMGYGTEKVEEELHRIFKKAKVIRMDVDTTRKKNSHEKLLERFSNQEGNILLGTQMIAKGLDFENVTFVGVIDADISLNFPDFRSNERTFQLLNQVAGRSGRGKKTGSVMIQTYNPDHYAIVDAAQHHYSSFFKREMQYRLKGNYPPFCHMVSLTIQGKQQKKVETVALEIEKYLHFHLQQEKILGPSEAQIYKIQDVYRQRFFIKYTSSKKVYEVLKKLSEHYCRQQNTGIHLVYDFNPQSA